VGSERTSEVEFQFDIQRDKNCEMRNLSSEISSMLGHFDLLSMLGHYDVCSAPLRKEIEILLESSY
jgi:hypothetical protein